jgi:hypothetical protein
VQIVPRPPDLVAVAVGQCAAQPAKAYYIGVPGSRAEYERVPAANGKLDPVTSWQAVRPRPAQRQMPAVVGDGVSSSGEPRPLRRIRPVALPAGAGWADPGLHPPHTRGV